MTKKILAAALLSAAMVGGTAYAQTSQPSQPSGQAPAASQSTTTTPSGSAATGDEQMMLKGSWRASKLMGLDVYNDSNEKLGDINEILVDKSGNVQAVVIGVGGFLGMGEHDIAVSMDKLKFMETPVRTSSTDTKTTTGAATGTGTTTGSGTATSANDWVPDHAVMSGTKEQLKAMKPFKYSDYN